MLTMLGIEDLTEKIKSWKPDYKKASLTLKTLKLDPINKFLDYFGIHTKVVKLNTILNRIQFPNLTNSPYGSKINFFEKSRGFFMDCRYR